MKASLIVQRWFVLLVMCLSAHAIASSDYQDIWWNPAQGGMGVFVGQQDDRMGIGWFHYGSDGKATYLLLAGQLTNGVVQGQLERSTGPQPGVAYDANQVARQYVGSGSITFQSENSATLSYHYDGKSGTINLVRMTFASATTTGYWSYTTYGEVSGCANPDDNGAYHASGTSAYFSADANDWQRINLRANCQIRHSATRTGALIVGSGSVNCDGADDISIDVSVRSAGDRYRIMDYQMKSPSRGSCVDSGKIVFHR